MSKKTPGKLSPPPAQGDFDKLPLARLCVPVQGVFYRLHSLNRASGKPWEPIYFSKRGATRLDHVDGVGVICMGRTLIGALMEMFNDRWGPIGDPSRSLTETELAEWSVSLIATHSVQAFDTANVSKIGTDCQFITGDHATAREWALRIMSHPANASGILYPSRHDHTQGNLALFNRASLTPAVLDPKLVPPAGGQPSSHAAAAGLVYGPPISLRDHPELSAALQTLEVARMP